MAAASSWSVAEWPSSIATTMDDPTSTSLAAAVRPRCIATRAPWVARSASVACPTRRPTWRRSRGAYPLDIDSDRHTDLVVLRLGENVLLRGLGECRFERANEELGLDGGSDWTTAFSATWETGAQLPTLAFGNYRPSDEAGALTAGMRRQRPVPSPPRTPPRTARRWSSRPAGARCRCSSATGTGRGVATCASATTASSTCARDRSSSGA